MPTIKVIENYYLSLLTIGLVVLVVAGRNRNGQSNATGAARILRESGQSVANLTRVASGGATQGYGYSILGDRTY
jgi:hypothetical protein